MNYFDLALQDVQKKDSAPFPIPEAYSDPELKVVSPDVSILQAVSYMANNKSATGIKKSANQYNNNTVPVHDLHEGLTA